MEQIIEFSYKTIEEAVAAANKWLQGHADVEVVARLVVYHPEGWFCEASCTIFIWYKEKK